jgi:hypothetical protein
LRLSRLSFGPDSQASYLSRNPPSFISRKPPLFMPWQPTAFPHISETIAIESSHLHESENAIGSTQHINYIKHASRALKQKLSSLSSTQDGPPGLGQNIGGEMSFIDTSQHAAIDGGTDIAQVRRIGKERLGRRNAQEVPGKRLDRHLGGRASPKNTHFFR